MSSCRWTLFIAAMDYRRLKLMIGRWSCCRVLATSTENVNHLQLHSLGMTFSGIGEILSDTAAAATGDDFEKRNALCHCCSAGCRPTDAFSISRSHPALTPSYDNAGGASPLSRWKFTEGIMTLSD